MVFRGLQSKERKSESERSCFIRRHNSPFAKQFFFECHSCCYEAIIELKTAKQQNSETTKNEKWYFFNIKVYQKQQIKQCKEGNNEYLRHFLSEKRWIVKLNEIYLLLKITSFLIKSLYVCVVVNLVHIYFSFIHLSLFSSLFLFFFLFLLNSSEFLLLLSRISSHRWRVPSSSFTRTWCVRGGPKWALRGIRGRSVSRWDWQRSHAATSRSRSRWGLAANVRRRIGRWGSLLRARHKRKAMWLGFLLGFRWNEYRSRKDVSRILWTSRIVARKALLWWIIFSLKMNKKKETKMKETNKINSSINQIIKKK